MKHYVTVFFITFLILLAGNICFAEGHVDPPFLQIQSAETPLTLDGKLDETDWQRRFDHLIFKENFIPGDVEYGITQTFLVDGDSYIDTTTTIVRILHYGMDLYISLQSDDKYVNKWGGSWEGDGLFMKVTDATGADKEFKLYFNAAGTDPDMVYEETVAGSGSGMGYKMSGTVVNDTTQIDSGYTAELVIHLDELGYTQGDTEIPVVMNIFDPDKQTGASGEEWNIGSYWKCWWGSEWGGTYRILRLADPPLRLAVKTEDEITLDGQLTESFWENANYVVVGMGSPYSTGGYYMQWGDTLNSYTDRSQATVKFVHKGTDLYIGVESNDSSVCAWSPGWEADGLFLWMTNKGEPAPTARMEIKNMYFNQTEGAGAEFQLGGSTPTGSAEGASYEPEGTLTHTETNGADHGYSLEVVVHTDYYGYSELDTVKLSVVIWDLDYSSSDAYDQNVADYAPAWWGTQWADVNFEKYYMYRDVVLSDVTAIENDRGEIKLTDFRLLQNYPNPFNPTTTIAYELPVRSQIKVEIFDLLGKKIATLYDAEQSAGTHHVVWDSKTEQGSLAGSGIYFYKVSTSEFSKTRKMILMK